MDAEKFDRVQEEIRQLYSEIYTIVPKEISNLIFACLNNFDKAIDLLKKEDKKN